MDRASASERSVLIVDDEPVICMGLLRLIDWSRYGYTRTDTRYTFEAGLEAALSHPYSLIITDICIHENNGLELIRAVKQRRPATDFVLISAYAEFEYAHTAISYGVKGYLLKPLNREALERCVASLSEGADPASGNTAADPPPEESALSKKNAKVQEVLGYLHEHYADKSITLQSVAKQIYANPIYLGQCFIQYTGLRFSDYLSQYRIQRACELLERSGLMVYEICERVGFNNPTYFHRVFKRVTGLSTAEYRERSLRRGREPR